MGAVQGGERNPSDVACSKSKKKSKPTLCILQANLLTAKLAGYWGRKSDGHPGPKTLSHGLEILAQLVNFLHLVVEAEDLPLKPKTRNRPREPD